MRRPRDEQVLTRDERLGCSSSARHGFDPASRAAGGLKTRGARFRARSELVPDGFASVAIRGQLRGR